MNEKAMIEKLQTNYPRGVDLVYVDYRDTFDENHDRMETLATTGNVGDFDDDFVDSEYDSMDYILKETFDSEEVDQIKADEDLHEAFRSWCWEHDKSNPIADILKNTGRRFFFYDTGISLGEPYDLEKEAKRVAKYLKISFEKYGDKLKLLLAQASYGGNLVILFVASPKDLQAQYRNKYIRFQSGYGLCVMNRSNGSGDHFMVADEPLTFKFLGENLHDDEGFAGYSYAGDVCGLCRWDESGFTFTGKSTTKIKVTADKDLSDFSEREKLFEKRYREGKCSMGDMKITRHRRTTYINDFPCGTKCLDCGTFWID